MRIHRRTAFGDVMVDSTTPVTAVTPAPAVVPAPTPAPDPGVAARTPPYTTQALGLLAVSAIPWVPVAAGTWIGDQTEAEHGRAIGAAAGFLVTFLALRHFIKKTAGTIT
jgi:hypothetical protein